MLRGAIELVTFLSDPGAAFGDALCNVLSHPPHHPAPSAFDLDEVIDRVTAFLAENENDPKALFVRAVAYQATQRYNESLADFDRLLELVPDHIQALWFRSEIRFQLGDLEGGRADRQLASALD